MYSPRFHDQVLLSVVFAASCILGEENKDAASKRIESPSAITRSLRSSAIKNGRCSAFATPGGSHQKELSYGKR
jgi:hypothetical protein